MKNKVLYVAEKFYSIQGEGVTMGAPAVFLRLSGCNLLCKSDDWVCDSIEVWQPKGQKTEFSDVLTPDFIDYLERGAHLIITGGEPLLHQKRLIEYLTWFKETYKFLPFIEIETNGTILPDYMLLEFIKQFNVSPKLSNSGETHKRRVNQIALTKFMDIRFNTIFKFVIKRREDFLEILQDFPFLDISYIVLMPAGDSQEALNETRPLVMELAKEMVVKYCDRLQIVNWNKTTGV